MKKANTVLRDCPAVSSGWEGWRTYGNGSPSECALSGNVDSGTLTTGCSRTRTYRRLIPESFGQMTELDPYSPVTSVSCRSIQNRIDFRDTRKVRIIAFVNEPPTVNTILRCLGEPTTPTK